MNDMIAWIAAEAERPEMVEGAGVPRRRRHGEDVGRTRVPVQELRSHEFPAHASDRLPDHRAETSEEAAPAFAKNAKDGAPGASLVPGVGESAEEVGDRGREDDRERRIYRGRTVAMLRRYMRYSMETGRLPSLLGGEIFRAKVTSYTVVTFEDRVIFVHDMEKCLGRLDEFSRQLIARHILQEHDRWATASLLHCNEKTVRRYTPVVLDVLSEILLEVGLLERVESVRENSCQVGESDQIDASSCDDGKYKV